MIKDHQVEKKLRLYAGAKSVYKLGDAIVKFELFVVPIINTVIYLFYTLSWLDADVVVVSKHVNTLSCMVLVINKLTQSHTFP